MYIRDTIAAVATPPGAGGVAIIRISGNQALEYRQNLFKPPSAQSIQPRQMVFGQFVTAMGDVVDYGYSVYFAAPASFTGEDVVEFHCHGGPTILRRLLRELFDRGCRPAEPGEFSKRAFVNGKLDLVQAEAIMDMVSARSEEALTIALSQFGGLFSKRIDDLSQRLLQALAQLEVIIDYPDMELDSALAGSLREDLAHVQAELQALALGFDQARLYREGLSTAILGSPNVGKSSLLNLLAGEDRAIVTDIPGTTRDVLEVPVNIRGIPLLLMDTAGIRESDDLVEQLGVERARRAAGSAQLILLVLDGSRSLLPQELALLKEQGSAKTLAVVNKKDLDLKLDLSSLTQAGLDYQLISAAQGLGVEELKDKIQGMFVRGEVSVQDLLVTNERHYRAIVKATQDCQTALAGLSSLPADLVAMDIRSAWEGLGEITGKVWTEDLLDCIFGNFCLGK